MVDGRGLSLFLWPNLKIIDGDHDKLLALVNERMNELGGHLYVLRCSRGAKERMESEPAQGRDARSHIAQPNNRRLWKCVVVLG